MVQVARDWKKLLQLQADNGIVQSAVIGLQQGWLVGAVQPHPRFCAASQVARSHGRTAAEERSTPSSMVGQTISLKVIEVDRERNRFRCCRRALATQEWRKAQSTACCQNCSRATCCGRVNQLTNFGAFIDLGGAGRFGAPSPSCHGSVSTTRVRCSHPAKKYKS
jgi:small subunit ribosomal protein S1